MLSYPPYDTAGTIINDAAVELGLASVSDPLASTDQNFIQLAKFLKTIGRRFWRWRNWTHLQQVYTFPTVGSQAFYPKPPDFGRIIDQTEWNRTNRLPMGGPLSPQTREYLRARLVGVVFTVLFSEMQGQILVYPDAATPGGYVIAYEYMSRWWVRPQPINPAWASYTKYNSGDVISSAGHDYVCEVGGYSSAAQWTAGTAYATGAYVFNGAPGKIYLCTVGGTSAGGGGGPSGTGSAITDGTCTWAYQAAMSNQFTGPASTGTQIQYDGGGVSGLTWRYLPLWAASTACGVDNGTQLIFCVNQGNIYRTTAAGTSAAGPGPYGTGLNIVDGTAVWKWFAPYTNPNQDAPSASSDVIWFDQLALKDALKVEWKKAKGLDFSAEQNDFAQSWNDVTADDAAAPLLSLIKGTNLEPLLGDHNIPFAGFGS